MNEMERARYARNLCLEDVGEEGQEKLFRSRVLIVGAGGLGSPAAMYLAAAGIGTIGLVDGDRVELSNLQRQIAHAAADVGRKKVDSAGDTLKAINPDVRVVTHAVRFAPENAAELIVDYDFVIDGVDNFATKFLLNDACVLAKKPFCHGGVLGFQGQAMTYVPGQGPCYRCVFEEIPEAGSVPDCRELGVFGAVPGVIGCIQAMEAVKYVLGAGELLTGRMLRMDGRSMTFRVAAFSRPSPACRVCGERADIQDVAQSASEYEESTVEGK